MLNLAQLLEESTLKHPQREAVVFGETRLTYQALNGAVNQIANGLVEMGIQPGDKIALSCPNILYFPMIYYAILKVGAVVVPLNVLFKQQEITYHLKDSQAKAYFCFEGSLLAPMAHPAHEAFKNSACNNFIVITAKPNGTSPIPGVPTLSEFMSDQPPQFDIIDTSPEDTAVILYTSGTTGQPKGAELSHCNMLFNARLADNNLFHLETGEVFLVTLPLFHSFGQSVLMNMGIYVGGTLVLMARFDCDEAFALMEKEKVTFFAGVPTMYWALLNFSGANKYNLNAIAENLRTAASGGSALPLEVIKDFEERFKVKILEGYGLSETSPVACFNHHDRPTKPGSVGQRVWGVQVKVVNEQGQALPQEEQGEVLIKGHNVMKGYYNRPEATQKALRNGWLYTGDIGKFDADGYLYITDRLKDMIIRGGYNIYPREIEEILMQHPAVSLSAVIGIPDDKLGEEVKAFVILKDGADLSPQALIAWSKSNMADYKYPRYVEIRETLPMTATGKILKRELKY